MISPNQYFESADWLVIAVYLVGIILFGLWIGKDQKNTRDYFLGSKSIPWWGVGLSIVATETSALTFIGVPALAYGTNLALLQIIIGYVIARIVLAIFLVPHYFKGEIYSPYQLFSNAFGPPARRTAAGFFLVAGTLAAGVRVYVTCIPLQLMLGTDKWVRGSDGILPAILLFVGLSLIYTYFGGIKAVVWTDAVQFFLFMAGGVFALLYIPQVFDGGFQEVFSKAAKGGKLDWLNLHFSLAMPYNLWMGIVGGTVHVLSSHGADQLLVQRVLTCKSVADGRKALLLSAVIIFPLFVIFLLTGAILWVYYQQFPLAVPIPETTTGISKNDYIYPIFILTAVPPVLKGFLIVAILSAAMSSVSSALSALASVSTMDLIKGLSRAKRAEKDSLRLSKYSTAGWAAALIVVAYASREVPFVFNAAFALTGLTSGALLGGLLAALFTKGGSALPVIVGMLTSLAVMIVVQLKTNVAWPWFTLIGATVTILVVLLVREVMPHAKRGAEPPE
jgi:SSS family solute:Na+ symporter